MAVSTDICLLCLFRERCDYLAKFCRLSDAQVVEHRPDLILNEVVEAIIVASNQIKLFPKRVRRTSQQKSADTRKRNRKLRMKAKLAQRRNDDRKRDSARYLC